MRSERPNDLDDYLTEVEDELFCVTREDRECLLRDLKGHVRELTTDPDEEHDFSGRYGITRQQLLTELGEPREIALDYMASVRPVPSFSMVALIYILMSFFILMAILGVRRISSMFVHPPDFLVYDLLAGTLYTSGGIALFFLTWWIRQNITKGHLVMPIILIIFSFASYPISNNLITILNAFWRDIIASLDLTPLLSLLLFDFFIIALLGLHVSNKHIVAIAAAKARR